MSATTRTSIFGLQFGRAQVLSFGFFVVVAAGCVFHQGAIVNLVYTPLAIVVAYMLYRGYPTAYLSFVFWLFLLTPFFRRLVDYDTGYNVLSPVLLAPIAAACICGLTVIGASRHLHVGRYVPLTICLLVCLYGLLLGIVINGAASAVFAFANWLAPIAIAIHILVHRDKAEDFATAIFRTLAYGGLVIGAYGIYQFYIAPDWDTSWMWEVDMNSIGQPYPGEIRVFSTLNAPGPMAVVISGCLLVLTSQRGWLQWVFVPAAAATFLLSLVRSAWGGFFIGGLVLLAFAGGQLKRRLLIATVVVGIIASVLIGVLPYSNILMSRFSTIIDLENDVSFRVRSDLIETLLEQTLSSPLGSGLGATGNSTRLDNTSAELGRFGVLDNGLLDLFQTFGWSALIQLLALLLMTSRAIRMSRRSERAAIATAVAVSTMVQVIFVNTLIGVQGMMIFPMLALAVIQPPDAPHEVPADPGRQ